MNERSKKYFRESRVFVKIVMYANVCVSGRNMYFLVYRQIDRSTLDLSESVLLLFLPILIEYLIDAVAQSSRSIH